ncbi:unnamed protein product [Lampetra fluviatilis]
MQLKPLERAERLKERLVRRQHKGEGGNCRHGNSGGSDRERGRGRHKQPLKRKREVRSCGGADTRTHGCSVCGSGVIVWLPDTDQWFDIQLVGRGDAWPSGAQLRRLRCSAAV